MVKKEEVTADVDTWFVFYCYDRDWTKAAWVGKGSIHLTVPGNSTSLWENKAETQGRS